MSLYGILVFAEFVCWACANVLEKNKQWAIIRKLVVKKLLSRGVASISFAAEALRGDQWFTWVPLKPFMLAVGVVRLAASTPVLDMAAYYEY